MCIRTIWKLVPVVGLLVLGACSGSGEDDDSGPPTPVTTTDYTVDFSATHVIGSTAAPTTVSASASLRSASGDDILASGTVTVAGTTATSVTINVGYAGENGPVALALVDNGGGNWGVPSGTELSVDELRRLNSTGFYVQIQSADGELRGQILPPGWAVGTIDLDGAAVVPQSTSSGTAKAGFAINPSVGSYYVRMTVSGVADVISAGIRDAIAGGAGELVASLEESMTTPDVWGSRDINDVNANDRLTATGIDVLVNGRLYFSVESAANPDGDLRGQIIDDTIDIFYNQLTASQVVTGGTPVVSNADGFATTTWIKPLSRMGVVVSTDITSAVSVGVYQGVQGENGLLLFSLMQDPLLPGYWQLPPTDLSAAQANALEAGEFYVSVVTSGSPDGELRGQLVMSPPNATVKLVGPAGGELATPDGISLQVPAGALTETLPISVVRLQGTGALPAPLADPVVPLHAAVKFGPSGTEFALPVSLSIALEQTAEAGASQPALVYDTETGTWRETDFIATVDIDGDSATVDLTHFSDYAVTFSEKGSAGYFGSVDLLTESRQAIFDRIRNRFRIAFTSDSSARPYDPGTVPANDPFFPGQNLFNCYAPRAITFILDTRNSTLPEIEPALVATDGSPQGATFIMAFSRFYEESYVTVVDDEEIDVELGALYQVFVYYFAVSPDIEIEASSDALWVAEQGDLALRVLCGDTGFKDQSVTLAVDDSTIGSIAPGEGSTDTSGMFDAVYSANATAGGTNRVTATTDWSEPVSGSAVTVGNFVDVAIFSLTGDWSGTGTETVTGCQDPEDNGTFEGSASYAITQDGAEISGSGFWTSFSGTVSGAQADGAFSISGSFTDSEDGQSTGSFSGGGSAANGVLNLTWNGSDTDDSCVFSGSGTATRLQL